MHAVKRQPGNYFVRRSRRRPCECTSSVNKTMFTSTFIQHDSSSTTNWIENVLVFNRVRPMAFLFSKRLHCCPPEGTTQFNRVRNDKSETLHVHSFASFGNLNSITLSYLEHSENNCFTLSWAKISIWICEA